MDRAETAGAALAVEVVCSPAAGVVLQWAGDLPPGSTLGDALRHADLTSQAQTLLAAGGATSVWGRRCGLDEVLRAGDRVELCRPLAIDPTESRRLRLREQRRQAATSRGAARGTQRAG